ncbi:MAG: hypothetical protein AB8H80_03010 [Planctomycetota bacterium]
MPSPSHLPASAGIAPRTLLVASLAFASSTFGTSCVAYEADDPTPRSIAAEVDTRTGGRFSYEEALVLALAQNPDLRAKQARLDAAMQARTVPLPLVGELRGRNEAVGLMVDPIALLGLGSRGAAMDMQDAKVLQAAQELAVAQWQLATELAEAFALDAELMLLRVPDLAYDADAFEAAGLASPVAAARLRAAVARADSERAELAKEMRDNHCLVRHLLGLPTHADVALEQGTSLVQPDGTTEDLLLRPDLALATARFEVADAAFWRAVQDQYPSILIGPNVSLRGDPIKVMGMLNLPLFAYGPAAAARAQRTAARDELEAALLAARHQAEVADHELRAADASLKASEHALAASATSLDAAAAAVEVQVDAFQSLARAATELMRDAREHRRAVLQRARSGVRRASAYGWPVPQLTALAAHHGTEVGEGAR